MNIIYLDRRNNKKETRLDDLGTCLRHPTIEKIITKALSTDELRFTCYGMNIKTLEPVNSKHYNLIQFSDILLGAFGYHFNQRHTRPDASIVKNELANYIAQQINVKNLKFSTSNKGYKNLNIWKFESSKIKSAL